MKKFFGLETIAILLFSGIAFSTYVSDFPESLEIGEKVKDFSFFVNNDTSIKRQVSIEYFLPGKYDVLESKQSLLPGESGKYTIRLFPDESLEGKTYVAALVVNADGDIFEKEFFVKYFSEDSCTVEFGKSSVSEKVFSVIAKNQSYKKKQLQLSKTLNFNTQLKTFDFLPFEEKEIVLEFVEKPKPKQELIAEFVCNEKTLIVKAESLDQNNESFFSGLFLLPKISFGLLLNVILAFIAALLLLVFIARLTKIMVKK